jgi:hypothetical protein
MKDVLLKVESIIEKRGISGESISEMIKEIPEIINRRIIGGYASVDIVDREKQRIPIPALKNTAGRFMDNPYFRLVTVFHSDVAVGRVLPKWTHPLTGETYTTHVDDKGWWVVCEIRDDIEIANKVWDEIKKGNLRSFSIAGSSREKVMKQGNGTSYEQVNDLDTCEIAVCEIPVNSMSHFNILWDPSAVNIFGY